MRNKATKDFPTTIYVTVGDRDEEGVHLYMETKSEGLSFADADQKLVAVYTLKKVQRLEKTEKLVDL